MPFKSKAQSRACYAKKSRGQAGGWDCSEWSKKTDYKKLPEKTALDDNAKQLLSALAAKSVLPMAFGTVNSLTSPEGTRLEGFGRGALYGAAIDAGTRIGSRLGQLAGSSIGQSLGSRTPVPRLETPGGTPDGSAPQNLADAYSGIGSVTGAFGGTAAGGYGAMKLVDHLLGPGSAKYRGEEEDSLPTALGKAAAKLAMTTDFTLSPTQSMLKPGPTGQGVPEYKLAPTGSPDPSRDPSETFAAAGG